MTTVTTVATVNRAVFARVNAQVGVDVQLIVSALAGSATKIAVGLKDHTTPITQPQVDRFNEILDIAKTTLGGVVSDLQSCAAKITSGIACPSNYSIQSTVAQVWLPSPSTCSSVQYAMITSSDMLMANFYSGHRP